MSGTNYNTENQVWQNDEQHAAPAVVDSVKNQQCDLPLRVLGAQSGKEDSSSSPVYEPFGPRQGNLQNSLLNTTVQEPLRMIVHKSRLPSQLESRQQEEQYVQAQALTCSTETMGK